jgi:hypothetical protein
MPDFDQIVFGKKKYSDVLKEIYDRNIKKENEIIGLISQLKGLIANVQDALTIVPLISQYMGMSIKNDDNLIRLTAVLQKAIDRGEETGDFVLTDDEKAKILEEAEHIQQKFLLQNNRGKA